MDAFIVSSHDSQMTAHLTPLRQSPYQLRCGQWVLCIIGAGGSLTSLDFLAPIADSAFRDEPGGRGVRPMSNPAATPSTQARERNGRSVRSESRTAPGSSCFCSD